MIIDPEMMRAWLDASCAAQGIAVVVTDSGVVAQVGTLLKGSDAAAGRVATAAASRPSAAPRGHDPERVERASPSLRRGDSGEIEDRGNDGRLTA
jgi:hypothetical protein